MRLWFTHSGAVPLRTQLVTQIRLSILAGDLKSGDRLPSTRELARRFNLHPNTASAGYKELVADGWIESRHGSGVYVADRRLRSSGMANQADSLVAEIVAAARQKGVSASELGVAMQRWLAIPKPERVLLIEPDENLSAILCHELQGKIALPMEVVSSVPASQALAGSLIVCLPSREAVLRREAPQGAEVIVLPVRSVPSSLAMWLPQSRDHLIGVVSRWPGFLEQARTMLLAAGFAEEALLLRDARKAGWRAGLEQASVVIADSLLAAAAQMRKHRLLIPFPILSEDAATVLRQAAGL